VWLEHLLSGVSGKNDEIDNVWPLLFLKYKASPGPSQGGERKRMQLSFSLNSDQSTGSMIPLLGEQEGGL
jgi:hypothetical protein